MKSRLRVGKIGILIVLVVLVAAEALVLSSHLSFKRRSGGNATAPALSLEAMATQVVGTCSNEPYRPSCYDREIPLLMDQISMEDAFHVTAFVQQQDPEYAYCHVLGHYLSGNETKKDPAKWKEVIARCPTGICSNGCIHGAFQERFRVEALPSASVDELRQELEGICDGGPNWSPTGLERATCYHALGHLTMYITDADADKAVVLCKELTESAELRNFRQLCFDGAFMQIFQPLEEEDFALIEGKQPTKETVRSFCDRYSGVEQSSCWSESWPLFAEEIKQPQGLMEFCAYHSDENEQARCRSAMFYVLTAQFDLKPEKIDAFCSEMPESLQLQCYGNAASRVLENDRYHMENAVRVCELFQEGSQSTECFIKLVEFAEFAYKKGSAEYLELCATLPQKDIQFCNESR